MQSVSSRIWTRTAVSISYDDNHYTTGTLTGVTTQGQSGSGCNGNEEVLFTTQISIAQSAGAVEYIDCISAEGYDIPKECPGYNTKQSHGEAPVMWERWEMLCTPSLPSLPGPLCPGVVAPDRVLSIGQTEL